MKLNEKHNSIEEQILSEQDNTPHRWMWVRRFILSIILVTLFMQTFYFDKEEQDIFISTTAISSKSTNKPRIILHTGFPPPDNISGLSIVPGKAAATAFSPNPTSFKEINMDHAAQNGESWWDRLFPSRHVHLVSVQLPVVSTNKTSVQGTLSICASKRERFGLGKPQVPDLQKCVNTVSVTSDDIDQDDSFGVLEWNPEVTIVLKKSKMYWLVVQAESEPFSWVYAQGGSNQYGTAFETETGWEFKLEGEPIPSAMVMVEDHPKD
jgi:hypothetical protein